MSDFCPSPRWLAAVNACPHPGGPTGLFPDPLAQALWLQGHGHYRPGSYIDLAFSSPVDCTAQLAGAFEELPIPYMVDVTHWESLAHDDLRHHIEQVGILLS